ncbi:hypothetical protein [Methylobacterium sp. NFXW15]|uniref:hypothetical protein n=1 Tax=Methylobacterium sp. NFXW15 TaxID=2819512 RepID=UPI003CF41993
MADDTENPFARIVRMIAAAEPVPRETAEVEDEDGWNGDPLAPKALFLDLTTTIAKDAAP